MCVLIYFSPRACITLPCVLVYLLALAPGSAGIGRRGSACGLPWRPVPFLGTVFSWVRPGSLLLPLLGFQFQLPLPKLQTSSVSMGMGEGCLAFSVPNICLYKQLCEAPPRSAPGLGPGEEVLCLCGGVGFLLWGRCLVGRAAALQSCGRPRFSFAGWAALDRFPNLSEPLFPPL